MKSPRFLYAAGAALAVSVFLAAPQPSNGQAGRNEEQLTATLVAEVVAQQKMVSENQTKIEEKVGLIAEEVRLARIYAGRSGGGKGVAK